MDGRTYVRPYIFLSVHPFPSLKPEAWLAGWASDWAGWASGLAGWTSGLAGCASGLAGWTSGLAGWPRGGDRPTENLPILQDFVPYLGRCPASPHEN